MNGNLAWASEGDRTLTSTPARVINPFIREITKAGQHVREYDLPADQFTVKGATEMLALSATQFLVLERSFFVVLTAANPQCATAVTKRLTNGKRSLVVIADDNFPLADSATDRNQVIVFEVQP